MTQPKHRSWIYTLVFVIFGLGLLIFLWQAPPETTVKLPYDSNHARFYSMGKKQAEKHCPSCHSEKGEAPLPKDHPPKYRCLFCHKKAIKKVIK